MLRKFYVADVVKFEKIAGTENPSDHLTKRLSDLRSAKNPLMMALRDAKWP